MQLSELFLHWGLSDTSAWNSPGALGRGHQGFAGLEKIPASKFGTQLLLYLNSKLSELMYSNSKRDLEKASLYILLLFSW